MTDGEHHDDRDRTVARLLALRPTPDLREQAGRRAEAALAAAATARNLAGGEPGRHAVPVPGARTRWAPAPRTALVAAIAVLLLGGGVAVRSVDPGPRVLVSADPAAPGPGTTLGPPGEVEAGRTDGTTDDAAVPGTVVVHVVGEVGTPGVVELPAGARVAEALAAAGGATATADLAAINLARVLVDGEQVLVPAPGAGAVDGPVGPGAGPATLDLNAADLAALDALPGIGPVLARRIVDWRIEHGRFTSVAELGEVSGIGPSLLAGLRDLVHV